MSGSDSKWPFDPDVIWQHISCKQRWVIHAWVGWRHLATLLRGRDDSFGKTLLKIAKTHTISCLRVRILTINNGDVPPPWTCSGTYPPPNLSIKPCLDMTSFGNLLLLIIALTHAGCGLKLCTVTINSDDIYPRACLARTLLKLGIH